MQKYFLWIGLAAAAVYLLWKKKSGGAIGSSATSRTAQATTAAVTTGTQPARNQASAAASGQGFGGWLAYGQNVLKNTTNTVQANQDATASVRNLGGTFASLWSGGGGAQSAQTSGSGAGVPLDYDAPGPNVRANQTNSGDDVNMDFSYDPAGEAGDAPVSPLDSYDSGWQF